jgi:hypothetical protein
VTVESFAMGSYTVMVTIEHNRTQLYKLSIKGK